MSPLKFVFAGQSLCWRASKRIALWFWRLCLTESTLMTWHWHPTSLQLTPSTGLCGACTSPSDPSGTLWKTIPCLPSRFTLLHTHTRGSQHNLVLSHCACVTRSPSIMGILVADRKFFGEIGSLDGGMKIYGGENVELGIRVSINIEELLDQEWAKQHLLTSILTRNILEAANVSSNPLTHQSTMNFSCDELNPVCFARCGCVGGV